jgi:hypothetical protein
MEYTRSIKVWATLQTKRNNMKVFTELIGSA